MRFLSYRKFLGQMMGIVAAGMMLWPAPFMQAQSPQVRIAGEIGGPSVTLAHSVSPRLAAAADMGRMSPATAMQGMTMYFQPTAQQKAALDALVQAQQTPGSPYYHQWLTPAQYASLFGMSDADLAKVQMWLQSQGFTIDRVANSRNSITFSGTAEQVESAFATELHNYVVDGEARFANATEISVPAVLNGVVLSVRGLNNFRPRPQVHFHRQATGDFTSSQTQGHYLTPGDVATIYDIQPAYNAGETGSGETITVLGQSQITASDIEAFETAAGLPVKDPTMTLVPNTGTAKVNPVGAGDEAESDLDVEYATGIGKGATINFVYTGSNSNSSVYDSLQYAVDSKIGGIISLSYGTCEPDMTQTDFNTLEAIMQQGAAQGQSIVVASGDDGSTACYADIVSNPKTSPNPTAKEEQVAVDYPASSAYATGIGGTEFPAADVSGANAGTYWKSASGSDLTSSALSYIPEVTWNDDSAQVGTQYGAQYALSAGGGGVSTFTSRPSWQSGVAGIPSGSFRLVPDISLNSSADIGGYLYCTSDTSAWTSGQKASCNSGFRDSATGYLTAGGGTSFATPIFAGMVAILDQKAGSTQGLLNSQLYSIASNAATYATVFHDITGGTNACTAGSSYCSSTGASEYAAAAGYDEATGLGSFDFNALMGAWAGATTTGGGTGGGTGSATFKLAATNVTLAAGSSGTSTVTVTPVNAFTGAVSFAVTATGSLATSGCYSIGNASVTGSAAATATLTIYTAQNQCSGSSVHSFASTGGAGAASVSSGPANGTPSGTGLPIGASALAGLLLFGFRRVRQVARSKTWMMLAIVALALTVGFATGCGTSTGSAPAAARVTAGAYTVSVTGTGANATASTSLTVTVQ